MVSISNFIKAFQRCYHSFEICSVFYEDGAIWRNVMTTFYLSKAIQAIPQNNIIYNNGKLKLVKIKSDISHLFTYLEGLKSGKVYFNGFEVTFENPFDYDDLDIVQDWNNRIHQTDRAQTFVLNRGFSVFNNNNFLIKILEQINADVIKMGFVDAFDFIGHHAGLDSYSTSISSDFKIILPVYFIFNSLNVDNGTLTVDLTYDDSFDDLQLNVIGRSEDHRKILFREKQDVDDRKTVTFSLQNMLPDQKLDVSLFSQSLPELQLKETLFVPINQPLLPFTNAYNQFHSLVDLETILIKPETLDVRKRSLVYEKAVCDLFSLCGLSTIHLGDHEILSLENKNQIGSADILAYDGEDHLLVIDCDSKNPDPKKMADLNHLCRYLGGLPGISDVKYIIPVIVSPNPSDGSDSSVLIIDGGMIQRLFKAIHFKSREKMISMITDTYFQRQFSIARKNWS